MWWGQIADILTKWIGEIWFFSNNLQRSKERRADKGSFHKLDLSYLFACPDWETCGPRNFFPKKNSVIGKLPRCNLFCGQIMEGFTEISSPFCNIVKHPYLAQYSKLDMMRSVTLHLRWNWFVFELLTDAWKEEQKSSFWNQYSSQTWEDSGLTY